jgi:hypothetical protein
MQIGFLFVGIGCVVFTSGCFLMGASLTAKAADVERMQCVAGYEAVRLRTIQDTVVLRVEGDYSYHLASGIGKVTGTRLVIRPPDGVTAEKMTRILQCHGAQAVLGHVDGGQIPNDPYWLPDTWVSIDVKTEEGNFVATLSADTVHDNLRILHNAQAFAALHRVRSAASAGM